MLTRARLPRFWTFPDRSRWIPAEFVPTRARFPRTPEDPSRSFSRNPSRVRVDTRSVSRGSGPFQIVLAESQPSSCQRAHGFPRFWILPDRSREYPIPSHLPSNRKRSPSDPISPGAFSTFALDISAPHTTASVPPSASDLNRFSRTLESTSRCPNNLRHHEPGTRLNQTQVAFARLNLTLELPRSWSPNL